MSREIVVSPENIQYWRNEYSAKTDEELIAISEGCHQTYATGVTAKIILSERREKFANDKHAELLAEIKKPHWSVSPSFYLLVVSVLLTAAALVVAFVGLPQSQSHAVAVVQTTQTIQPEIGTTSSSPSISQHSSPTPTHTQKR